MACRDMQKAQKAANNIKQQTKNENIEIETLDLSDLISVRLFSDLIHKKFKKLDLLINNAGIMMSPNWRTRQGFEMQFGTNHLGHFLLTNLLLDLLKNAKASRIINVSSRAHYGKITFIIVIKNILYFSINFENLRFWHELGGH
jgi:retinol dehydrogenase-12